MKKDILKSSIRNTIDGILIFLLFITTTVYALPSNGVIYDNTNSGSTATNVNDALDDLYTKTNEKQTEIDRINGIGDAAANHILSGKTAYVKGATVTGTIPSKGAATYTPGTSNQTIASGNYLSGNQTIKGDANLVAGNIAKGKTIFNIAGSYTSDATAAAGNILKGKTAYVNGSKITGTMDNFSSGHLWINGDNGTFITNGNYTFSNGTTTNEMVIFHSKNKGYFDTATNFLLGTKSQLAPFIKVGTNLLGVDGTFTSDANAAAGNILSGKTAYVNGSKISGTIPSKGAATYTPSTSNQTIASGNYLSGVQTIKGDANLVAGNIAKGKTIFGVAGTYTSDANAAAGNILKDKTAYVNGNKITGSMPNNGAINKTITVGGSVSLPAGYTSGGTVRTTHTIKSWTPNYGNWVNAAAVHTNDTYNIKGTNLYVLARAENGGSVSQYSAPSCSNGTVTLLINTGAGVLYQVQKTNDATFTLDVNLTRNYSQYPNSTLVIYAFTAE